jgi:lipopolysaccharide transport system ATP-binding protein
MAQPIVNITNLSKRYTLGTGDTAYKTLRESINAAASACLVAVAPKLRPAKSVRARSPKELWALKDLTFSVEPGEIVGLIGRNGAGKSTLLKVLAKITEPTAGRIEMRGRVASLLEVGTGFHPELTGRENLYLSGAILGMPRSETRRKFDEIVAFAQVERFIDTPVKRYSSGMYTRLAFAVSAHLDPEILLVDEVLAVGDAEFQKKCLGKMENVARNEGRTVLFVSHNLHAVTSLCPSVLLLHKGQLVEQGPTRKVIENYLSSGASRVAEETWSFESAPGNELVRLRAVRVTKRDQTAACDVATSEPFQLEIEFWCLQRSQITPSFHIFNSHGLMLFATANYNDNEWGGKIYDPGLYSCSCTIPAFLMNEGRHYVNAYLSRDTDGWPYVQVPSAVSFQVVDDSSARGRYVGEWPGLVRPLLQWSGVRLGDDVAVPLPTNGLMTH